MSRFQHEVRQKAKNKVRNQGYSESGEQHNGCLFTRLTGDGYLLRKVVTMSGNILTYKARKANKRERQLYALS